MLSRGLPFALVALAVASGCSSGPRVPHVGHVGTAHVRAEWMSQLADGLPVKVAPPARQVRAIRAAARRGHAQVVGIEFYRSRSGGRAPAVVLGVSDPARFLKERLARFLTSLHRINGLYGDDYVGVVDAGGKFVWENGRAHLPGTFAGSLWIRPDLDSCSPVSHSQPALAPPPPPCPD